jgi:tetratricopeptide (TPR) repeat protein
MNRRTRLGTPVSFAMLIACTVSGRAADVVERTGGASALQGEIISVSRTELTLKTVNKKDLKVPANEIERVRFDGEKPQLNLIRSEEAAGRLESALAGYQAAHKETSAAQANLRADLEFLIARTTAKLAQIEGGPALEEAARKLETFRQTRPDSFRYFETVLLLGEIHLARQDIEAARESFDQLARAPWNDHRMAARNAMARLLLSEGKVEEALAEYEAVISLNHKTRAESARHNEARLGKSACMERKGDFAAASQILEEIIDNVAEEDTSTQAEACVRLGNVMQSAGNTREALLAYLRVDVLYFQEKAFHAEALYHLSQLWIRDGKPDRAADASTALQAKYPTSPWARKLSTVPSG